ncbi:MAG: TlpA family protein disulfide reductase [Chitinophagaceae bacterium]|nr:TlpA family protein disulfide reductase [Chitinophagaceae bacterium]
MQKKVVLLFVFIFSLLIVHGQSKELSIGDRLPSLVLAQVLNHTNSSISMEELKGKALLLDFGASTCLPCLKAMPLLDSIQKRFGDQLQVLMITKESREDVAGFLKKNKIAKQVSFPVVTEDSILNELFPHTVLPHEVWINSEGVVAAITGHEYLSMPNVQSLLAKHPLNWPVKSDVMTFDHSTTTLCEVIPQGILPDYVLFSSYLPGYKSSGWKTTDTVTGKTRLRYINLSILQLYRVALYLSGVNLYPSRLVTDPSLQHRLYYDTSAGYKIKWEQSNSYCYEMATHVRLNFQELSRQMIRDLNSYLRIDGGVQTIHKQCWVLRIATTESKSSLRKGANRSLLDLYNYYNRKEGFPPFLNKTGLSDRELNNLFIGIGREEMDCFSVLQERFQEIGFVLTEEMATIEVLVLKNAKDNN